LLLGFAFVGAVDRFKVRRDLIVHEANAIGTPYLRIDLLQPEDQPAVRTLFGDCLQARLDVYRIIDLGGDPAAGFEKAGQLEASIWRATVAGVSKPDVRFAAEVVLLVFNARRPASAGLALKCLFAPRLEHRSPLHRPNHEGENGQSKKHHEEYLCDRRGSTCKATEAEGRGSKSDNEEHKGPTKHGALLLSQPELKKSTQLRARRSRGFL
jgi:hypothetical protein